MSIKYNEIGEVLSVNSFITGQQIGTVCQDAAGTPECNEPYYEERHTARCGEEMCETQPSSHNCPLAYQVSSADELPADAVDGSLATVTYVIGTTEVWQLNDELTDLGDTKVIMDFTTADSSSAYFNRIMKESYGPPGVYCIRYSTADDNYSTNAYVYESENMYGITPGWQDESYKTLRVAWALETNKWWLEENGVKIGEDVSTSTMFYARENGEWVYKTQI